MAFITLSRKKLEENHQFLGHLFESRAIEWGVVTKILCGNVLFLEELINKQQ